MRETSKCEFLTGTSRLDVPANLVGGGRCQCADFVLHAVAFRLRNQSGFKQNLIVVAQPELSSKLFLCLLRRRFPLGADAVHLLFCCKYPQRELESCSSSSPPPASTSCPFAFLHDRPRRDRGKFSFAGAFCGAYCRCAAAWSFRRASAHRPSSAPQHGQGAQRRAQDHCRSRDPRAGDDLLLCRLLHIRKLILRIVQDRG